MQNMNGVSGADSQFGRVMSNSQSYNLRP